MIINVEWESDLSNNPHLTNIASRQACIRINIISLSGLPSYASRQGNYVYVQARSVPSSLQLEEGKSLPSMMNRDAFEIGEHRYDFQFSLPYLLPSSIVLDENNYIRYSIYSNFDIQFQNNFSTRTIFTVIQPSATALNLRPINLAPEEFPIYGQCFFCNGCFCCKYGNISVSGSTDRGGYAPGEYIKLNLNLTDQIWEDIGDYVKPLSVYFNRIANLSINKKSRILNTPISCLLEVVYNKGECILIQVPPVGPQYVGGHNQNSAWLGYCSRL